MNMFLWRCEERVKSVFVVKSFDLLGRPPRYHPDLRALGATVQSASCNTFSLRVSHLNVSCAELSGSRGVVKFN